MHGALMVKVENNPALSTMPGQLVEHLEDPQLLLNPQKLSELAHQLPANAQEQLQLVIVSMREALNTGLSHVFQAGTIAMIFAVLLVFFLKEVPLRSTMHKEEE
jgi:hypothetical protein